MNARSPGFRGLLVALVSLNGWFAFLIWSPMDKKGGSEVFAPALVTQVDLTKSVDDRKPITPPASVEEITTRPLFSRGRIAWAAPAPPVAQTPPSVSAALDAKIMGIVATLEMRTIFIVTPSAPQGVWIGDGELIEGWKVVRVTPKSATLTRDGASKTLYIFPDEQ